MADQQQKTSLTVAQVLRLAREEAGLSVADLSRRLNIAEHHIQALEQGRYGDLPGRAYVSGFIRNIASHLELDEHQVMRLFQQETGNKPPGPDLAFRVPHTASRQPSGRLLLLSGVVIAALLGGGWLLRDGVPQWVRSLAERQADVPAVETATTEDLLAIPAPPGMPGVAQDLLPAAEPQTEDVSVAEAEASELPPLADVEFLPMPAPSEAGDDAVAETAMLTGDEAAPVETVEPMSPEAETGAVSPVPEAAETPLIEPIETVDFSRFSRIYGAYNRNSRLAIEAVAPAWVRVTDEAGQNVFTQILQAGEVYRAPDQEGLSFRTGNAGGVRLIVDGQRGAILGQDGEVLRNIPLVRPPQRQGAE